MAAAIASTLVTRNVGRCVGIDTIAFDKLHRSNSSKLSEISDPSRMQRQVKLTKPLLAFANHKQN